MTAQAQHRAGTTPPDVDGLERFDGYTFPVWGSPDAPDAVAAVAARTSRALDWLSDGLGRRPPVRLFVPGPQQWDVVAEVPIYGLPQAFGDRVIVGAQPWAGFPEVVELLWPDLQPVTRQRLREVYGDPPDLDGFAELLVVHELTHVFHDDDESKQAGDFPRLWLAELFANLGMYGYVAEVEPERLPAVEAVCLAARELAPGRLPVRALDQMGAALEHSVAAYSWYQFALTAGASRLWHAVGAGGLRAFYDTLRGPQMNDREILAALAGIHPQAARINTDWPR